MTQVDAQVSARADAQAKAQTDAQAKAKAKAQTDAHTNAQTNVPSNPLAPHAVGCLSHECSMTLIRLCCLVIMTAALMAGCNAQQAFDAMAPQEEAAQARQVIAQLAARDFASVQAHLDPTLQTSATAAQLAEIANHIPAGTPKHVRLIGFNTVQKKTDVQYSFAYEYEWDDQWMVAQVMFYRKAGQLLIAGVHVNPVAQSERAVHAFSLAGKGPLHLLMLGLSVLVPLFILTTLVICYRTPVPKRKALWYLFIAVGLVQFTLNWTSGAINVQLLAFLVLGAGFMQGSAYTPLLLSVALPVGAVVFLLKRRSWLAAPASAAVQDVPAQG